MSSSGRYYAGSLSKNAEKRSYPTGELVKLNPGAGRSIILKKQNIPVVDTSEITPAGFNIVMSYFVSRFFREDGHHNINPYRLVCCIAGIIANCFSWSQITPWTPVINAFKTAGIQINFQPMTITDFRDQFEQDQRLQEFLLMWDTDIGYMLEGSHLPFIYATIIILAMTKNLNENNFLPWFTRRIMTFSGTTGDSFTPSNTNETQYPELSQVSALNVMINGNFLLKKQIYLEILSLATKPKNNFISVAFAEIHHLMRGHEMQHLILIDKYIFEEHPEFLGTQLLKGLESRFKSAIQELRRYGETEQLYIKFLEDKDKCALLNRKIFEAAAVVATKIAQMENSTFEFYYFSKDKISEKIRCMVEEYITLKERMILLAIGGRDKQNMPEEEKTEYFKRALIAIEEKYLRNDNDISQSMEIVLPATGLIQ